MPMVAAPHHSLVRLILGGLCLCASVLNAPSAGAEVGNNAPPPAATAFCDDAVYRAFDFWLGAWEVFTPQGAKAGDNVIEEAEGGCLLVERWTSVTGGTGQSYNYVDAATGEWRQIWVSGPTTIDYAGGLDDQGDMVLEGEIAYRRGDRAPFRGRWSVRPDGTVRQHFEQFDADAKAWRDWFIGIYRRPHMTPAGDGAAQ